MYVWHMVWYIYISYQINPGEHRDRQQLNIETYGEYYEKKDSLLTHLN